MRLMFRNTVQNLVLMLVAAGLTVVMAGCNPAAPIGTGVATGGNSNTNSGNDNGSVGTTDPDAGAVNPGDGSTDPTPGAGGDPTDPVDGGDVTDPADPIDPADPSDPVAPIDPVDPVDPTDPVDPENPVDPGDTLIDLDSDGVPDVDDACPGTARGVEVDSTGCEIVVDPGGGGGGGGTGGGGTDPAECGNGIQESGEQCDPPDGTTCDDNCALIPDAGPAGDDCGNAQTATDGDITFTTVGATTDGPDGSPLCDFVGDANVASDIWYCYTASCDGLATIGLCGSGYDTKLAVYAGCGCPAGEPLICSDDDCGSTYLTSRTTLAVTAGEQYTIRIGGFGGDTGDGFLHIACGQQSGCPADATGDCFDPAGNGSPGCADPLCCVAVCNHDRFCCDVEWDARCASEAEGYCADGAGFASCGAPDTANCATNDGQPGCSDTVCCQSICEQDPICCLDGWDDLCADNAADQCAPADVCTTSTEACDRVHPGPGCNDTACCQSICDIDPSCCSTTWTAACTDLARTTCRP